MKKFLHRRHASHSPPPPTKPDSGRRSGANDSINSNSSGDALKASLYEDTTSRSPPRVGSTPIRGTHEHPPAEFHGPSARGSSLGPGVATTTQARATPELPPGRGSRPDGQRETPTNFSRLPPNRLDAVRSQARLARADPRLGSTADDRDLEHDGVPADFRDSHVPPSPTAIHPQDLASPEFSYLSNVYGGPSKGRSGPRDAPPASSRPGERLDHRAGLGPEVHPSGPRTSAPDLARPDDPPRDMASMPGRKPIRQSDASAGFVNPANTATAESRGAGPGPGHAKAIDETAERLRGVVNLTDTVDTEVITREAPAVVHETVIPTVHEIREERIEREIHTYDVVHRIQPVIDVEVLPPRHFVPTTSGGLREVSADELPGRQGHWGIVETVTKRPGEDASTSSEPRVMSSETSVGPEGYPRTDTVVRHPPTLETGAMRTGQSWPILVDPDVYAERHRLPLIGRSPTPESRHATDPVALNTNATSAATSRTSHSSSPSSSLAAAATTSGTDGFLPDSSAGHHHRGQVPAPGSSTFVSHPPHVRSADPSSRAMASQPRASDLASAPVPHRDVRMRDPGLAMPGTFPSSASTATIKTLRQHPAS
ncbi:MAG: hypothetical protein M1815_000577 [Lichina confinis]|nr:MAG: hypothetical protein M1815_000577 [Lichina confinis]